MNEKIVVHRAIDEMDDTLTVEEFGDTWITIRAEDPITGLCRRSINFPRERLGAMIVALEQIRRDK